MERGLRAEEARNGMYCWALCCTGLRKRETMGSGADGMKRSLVILAIVAVGVCTVGLGYELRARSATDAGSLPALLNMAPADSTFIAYADVAALRQNPLLQRAAAMAQPPTEDRDYVDFVHATGFDYQRDLDRVLLATGPGAAAGGTIAVAEGRFDQKKIEEYALRSGKIENQNGRAVYVVPSATPGKNISFAFLSAERIAVSDGGNLFAMSGGLSPAPLDSAMHERLSRVAAAPFFFAAKTPTRSATGTAAAPGTPSLLESVRWVDFAARPDNGNVILSAEGECSSPEEAQKVATTLQFLRGVLQGALADPKAATHMSPASASATAQLLKAANITTTAERVRLLVTMTPDMLNLNAAAPAAPSGR